MQRTATGLLWADALAALARAERMHRGFFEPAPAGWEPPVDLLETHDELVLIAALPGVRVSEVELVIGGGELAIIGIRRLPAALHNARIHRMELPHGRFERRVPLPAGTYDLVRRDLSDGCLTVVLRKLG
ncbi:Hsp20/alpha crystallin family protein [Roseomonas sp. BN140053]|uniref:Hsp20/alpha crystallin family protein n=1 Tax=Roseomonas sp. BN140053 TaxID=3391898 RepID=UPI0039EB79A4